MTWTLRPCSTRRSSTIVVALAMLFLGCAPAGSSQPGTTPPASTPPASTPPPAQSDDPFWIAVSSDGGQSFRRATPSGVLGHEYVNGLTITPSGWIYLISTGGLLRSNDGGASFTKLRDRNDLGNPDFNDIEVDASGVIYVATNRGLWISGDQAKSFRKVTMAAGLGSDEINGVTLGKSGHVYVATNNGVSISRDNGTSFDNHLLGGADSNDNIVYQVHVDRRGTIYAFAYSGLSVSSSRNVRFAPVTCCEGYGVRGVQVDPSGRVYVASDIGMFTSTDAGKTFTAKPISGATQEGLTDVRLDESGTLYASTPKGMWISNDAGATFTHKTAAHGLPSDDIQRILADDTGTIYAAHWIPPYSDKED